MAQKKVGDSRVAVGNIRDVSGEVNVAGGDIYKGFTADQVSTLIKQISTTLQSKKFDGRCPYKGLDVFEEEDAELFFGRERLVDDLMRRVKESRTVVITGPSGSGKSSLVRAGLIHALKKGKIKGSNRWLYETMKPGREPIKELSLAFSRLSKTPELANYFQAHANEVDILNQCAESILSGQKNQRFVLFVDQFEEVFTQISQEEEREAFISMLAHAGTVENGRVIVLFAMRSDFISNCAAYPALNELLSHEFRQIGAMQPDELVAAIALPAKAVGLPIEDDLIARIINDMKGEPGVLPLMQFALKDLFDSQQAKGGVIALTLEDYVRHGGIQKSLERHANASLAALDEKGKVLARSIFSGLIEIGRGTVDTKRTALFDELVPANTKAEEILAIVQKLADARLIITDEQAGKDTVTISHEKLIEAWPWLKKLVNENRDVIALQNEIAGDAKEWEDHRRDPSYLYTGARLSNAREQLEAKKLVLSGTTNEFVIVGQAQQQRNQRTRMLGVAIPIGLVILAIIVVSYIINANSANAAKRSEEFANTQQASASTSEALAAIAQNQTKIARAGELAAYAVSQRDSQFDLSLLLSLEAFRTADITQTRSALLYNTLASPQLVRYLNGHSNPVVSVAFSPDGKTLVSGSLDNTIILWDVASQTPFGQPLQGHRGDKVMSVAFSPDNKTLASGSADGTIILWDVETQQPIAQLRQRDIGTLQSVVFSPDGKILASASGSLIILWDVETHQPIGQRLDGHASYVLSVAFSPDGKTLASGTETSALILWDLDTHQPSHQQLVGGSNLSIQRVAFSPDGKTLATGGADRTIILWDLHTYQPIGQPLEGHNGFVESVAFSPDGKTLASGSADHTIILWDVGTHLLIRGPLQGHGNSVLSVTFSPDGKMLASGGEDKAIILWDVETHLPIGQPFVGHRDGVTSLAFSPDGKMLALGSEDKTITLWDVETHLPLDQLLEGQSNIVLSVAFSPDGKILASGGFDSTISLWDMETYQPIGHPLQGHGGIIQSVNFSPDGKILASGSQDNTIILWDVETRRPIGQPLLNSDDVTSVAFSPDGKIIASGGWDDKIVLWDVETRQPIGQPIEGHSGPVSRVVFSPDGKSLASGSWDDTIILWDVETHQPVGESLQGNGGAVLNIAFSPDGKLLASGNYDNTLILWDVETLQAISQPILGHSNFVRNSLYSIAFSPDGKTVVSGSGDEMIMFWDLDPDSWVKLTCQRASRNFTRAEWARYFPNEDYRITCPQWSLEPEITPTPLSPLATPVLPTFESLPTISLVTPTP